MSNIDYLKETAVALGIFDDPSDDEHILIASFVDEIKRLRGIIEELDENLESADDELKFRQERIEELESVNHSFPVCRDHTQAAIDMEGCALCRIEELEDDLRKEWLVGFAEADSDNMFVITEQQIDRAVARVEKAGRGDLNGRVGGLYIQRLWEILYELGIVRCYGSETEPCPDCNGHGWVKK